MKEKLLKLAKMVLKFESTMVGEVEWIHEGPLAVGVEVFVQDEAGEFAPVQDGEYVIEDKKVKVLNGKVDEIEALEVEEPMKKECMEEAPVEEPAPAPDEKDLKIKELEGLLADRDAVIEELTAKVKELEAQIAKPVEEPVSMNKIEQLPKVNSENKALKYFN